VGVLDRVTVDQVRLHDPEIVKDPWFDQIPVIDQLIREGIDLDPRITVIVGENGSGKSTFVEALAHRWRSRLTAEVEHWGPDLSAEDAELHKALDLDAEWPPAQGGCFLRAEAMHGLFTELDRGPAVRAFGSRLNTRSHGESILAYLESRLTERGLFVLDEPEAALSFTSCLRLISILTLVADGGSQVVLATHSPVLAAVPEATVLEFGDAGFRACAWDELELTEHWRTFLARPDSYLRHLR